MCVYVQLDIGLCMYLVACCPFVRTYLSSHIIHKLAGVCLHFMGLCASVWFSYINELLQCK